MMKTHVVVSVFVLALLAATTPSHAQSSGGDQDKGATNGWSGGTKDQSTPGGANSAANSGTPGQSSEIHDQAETPKQPFLATGLDLNGPPKQFQPSKTPE